MHERERNADIVEESVARVSNTVTQPRKKDVSVNSFVKEQERKKQALDDLMAEQNARLASLNSPLPSLIKKVPKITSDIGKPKRPYVPPPFPPKTISTSSPAPAPGLSLSDLTMNRQASNVRPEPISTPSPAQAVPSPGPAPGLSIAELTMNRSKKPESTSPIPAPPSNAPSPRLSLAEMTMLKKPSSGGGKKASETDPVRKRPVRQRIPKFEDEDDEDDDFEAFSRGGDAKNMSIKDIMAKQAKKDSKRQSVASNKSAKEKSKMWGIDIDKFNF